MVGAELGEEASLQPEGERYNCQRSYEGLFRSQVVQVIQASLGCQSPMFI